MGQQGLKQLGPKAARGPERVPARVEAWAWCSIDSCKVSSLSLQCVPRSKVNFLGYMIPSRGGLGVQRRPSDVGRKGRRESTGEAQGLRDRILFTKTPRSSPLR